MYKRLVRKLDLETLLYQVKPHPAPKPNLEQYTIPADIAATILYMAAYTYNDIVDKTVLDAGCGTGRLGLGAAFLGAKQVVGVDIDKDIVNIALEHSKETSLSNRLQWITADIEVICGKFDTVLQNPPFGIQQRGADRRFLKKALEVGRRIYSLHRRTCQDKKLIDKLKSRGTRITRTTSSGFVRHYIENHNGRIRAVFAVLMTIPHMFGFHTKRKHEFIVDLYVIEKR